MIALIVLLVILVALWNLPLGVDAEYSHQGPVVKAVAGPFSFLLYPREKKAEKKPKEKQSKEKKPEAEKKPEEQADKKGGKIAFFRELLGLGLQALGHIRRKLRLNMLTIHLTVGGAGEDPAASAILYGRAWAAIGALVPLLEHTFVIGRRDIQAAVDFTEPDNNIYAHGNLTMKLGDILCIAVYYGVRGLKIYLNHKKGGNEHGTSHQ